MAQKASKASHHQWGIWYSMQWGDLCSSCRNCCCLPGSHSHPKGFGLQRSLIHGQDTSALSNTCHQSWMEHFCQDSPHFLFLLRWPSIGMSGWSSCSSCCFSFFASMAKLALHCLTFKPSNFNPTNGPPRSPVIRAESRDQIQGHEQWGLCLHWSLQDKSQNVLKNPVFS